MTTDRLQVVSTRMNSLILSQRLKSVQRGFSLLKCKSDALQMRCKELETILNEKERLISDSFRDAFERLFSAEFCGANLDIFTRICKEVKPKLGCNFENAFGLNLATFRIEEHRFHREIYLQHGHLLRELKDSFDFLLTLLVDTATIKNQLEVTKSMLEMTNKRKNSLEYKMIPKLENTVNYIENEMDEMEREEFFRLKKLQSSRQNKE